MGAPIRLEALPYRLIAVAFAALALWPARPSRAETPASAARSALILERVVIVQRHGVRSPTRAPAALSTYSAQPWPEWPVGPGELTPHGATDVRLIGGWLRRHYASLGLLPVAGCPAAGSVDLLADGKDQRTRLSGEAWLDGAFPGCGLAARHGPDGEIDPLFDAVASGACPMDAQAAKAAILARVAGDLDDPGPRYAAARDALRGILDPAATACPGASPACFLADANSLAVRRQGVRLQGPLATSATLAETLMLEWAEGMPAEAVGWGRAGSEAAIGAVAPLHEIEADLMRRTPYVASHNGALMARAIARAVEGPARLVVIVGHDTNLDNLAGILGLDWSLPGQPDRTAPDSALVFEVWRDRATGARRVTMAVVYQTLAQLRAQAPLDGSDPARRVDVQAPGCGGVCSVDGFLALIKAALPAACDQDRAPSAGRGDAGPGRLF